MHGVERRIDTSEPRRSRASSTGSWPSWRRSSRGRLDDHPEGPDARSASTAKPICWWGRRSPRDCSTIWRRRRSPCSSSAVVYESRERVPDAGRDAYRKRPVDRDQLLERTYRPGPGARRKSTRSSSAAQSGRGLRDPLVFHWAEGKPLEDVLEETEMAPGDFVRNCKQLIDLLRQIEDVAERPTAHRFRDARARRSSTASSPTLASSYDAAHDRESVVSWRSSRTRTRGRGASAGSWRHWSAA